MSGLRVGFIGGLSNGEIALDYLASNTQVELVFVVTHPLDSRPPRYRDFRDKNLPRPLIHDLQAGNHLEALRTCQPDLVLVAGWSGMLSEELISLPAKGTIGFHPSRLPADRGRSVLAWQLEEGYTETALTMFYYNALPDCGDIIAQERIAIEHNDYVSDVLDKVDEATYSLMRAYFPLVRLGNAPRRPQSINEGNFRRLRSDRDSMINWDRNAQVIYNKIRAASRPYPGALMSHGSGEIRVWRAWLPEQPLSSAQAEAPPGAILSRIGERRYLVRCRDHALVVEVEDPLEGVL